MHDDSVRSVDEPHLATKCYSHMPGLPFLYCVNSRYATSSNRVRPLIRVLVFDLALSYFPPPADDGKLGTKLYHAISLAILAGTPLAIATSPSAITMPIDVVLGVALPVHAHIGMNYGKYGLV